MSRDTSRRTSRLGTPRASTPALAVCLIAQLVICGVQRSGLLAKFPHGGGPGRVAFFSMRARASMRITALSVHYPKCRPQAKDGSKQSGVERSAGYLAHRSKSIHASAVSRPISSFPFSLGCFASRCPTCPHSGGSDGKNGGRSALCSATA